MRQDFCIALHAGKHNMCIYIVHVGGEAVLILHAYNLNFFGK